jgi:3-oxoacyl-[acyl-carrier-protein] synthase-1
MSRAWFIGSGIHTALGRGIETSIATLQQPLRGADNVPIAETGDAAAVPYRLLADEPLTAIEQRFYRVLEPVIEQALAEAGLDRRERAETALLIGTSSADISVSEARYRRQLRAGDPAALPLADSNSLGNVATAIRRRFGLRGPDYTFNTACTASANALLYAAELLAGQRVRHALVVGVELFNTITALGFHGLGLLSKSGMKPFDRHRDGLILGEAVAALVLGPQPRRPGAFHLRGGANLCETHSVSAANPDGSTVAAVMRQALAAAGLAPAQIDALKTHGTASLLNDEAEVAGLRRLFAAPPPLCALKPFIGHTLGACGLAELVLLCGAAERGFLPGTPGICAGDSDLGVVLNQRPLPLAPGHFMLNYFGFGGNNTSLIVSNLAVAP